MARRRVTREWGRASKSGIKGARRSSGWKKILGVVVVVAIAFFVGKAIGGPDDTEPVAEDVQATLDVGGGTGSSIVSDVLSGEVLSIPVDDAIVLDEVIEDEADIAQDTTSVAVGDAASEIALTAVDDWMGSGSATIQYADGSTQHVVVATLPDPPVGYFYEGWLVRSKPFDFFSTGAMIQHADDLKWYLLWEDNKDVRDYKKVVITLEPDDRDPAPAEHVLEGMFR